LLRRKDGLNLLHLFLHDRRQFLGSLLNFGTIVLPDVRDPGLLLVG
jgi:hypothetical protein